MMSFAESIENRVKTNSPASRVQLTGEGGGGPEVASGLEHASPWQLGQGTGLPRGCVWLGQ